MTTVNERVVCSFGHCYADATVGLTMKLAGGDEVETVTCEFHKDKLMQLGEKFNENYRRI